MNNIRHVVLVAVTLMLLSTSTSGTTVLTGGISTGGVIGTTASAPFLPTDIAGCKLWLRADMGITKNESLEVSAWSDQSGNGNDVTQSIDDRKGVWTANVISAIPAILFPAGTAGMLTTSSIAHLPEGKAPFTIFAVARGASDQGAFALAGWNRNNTTGSFLFCDLWGTPKVYMFHTDWSEEGLLYSNLSPLVQNVDYHFLINRDGVSSIAVTRNGSTQSLSPADLDVGSLDTLAIGAHSYGGTDLVYG